MQYVLVDIADRANFYPFSLTRSLAECRVGLYNFQERWEQILGAETGVFTEAYLQILYPSDFLSNKDSIYFINITAFPSMHLVEKIKCLKEGEKLISPSGKWIATRSQERTFTKILLGEHPPIVFNEVDFIDNAVQLLKKHAAFIQHDFTFATQNRTTQQL